MRYALFGTVCYRSIAMGLLFLYILKKYKYPRVWRHNNVIITDLSNLAIFR